MDWIVTAGLILLNVMPLCARDSDASGESIKSKLISMIEDFFHINAEAKLENEYYGINIIKTKPLGLRNGVEYPNKNGRKKTPELVIIEIDPSKLGDIKEDSIKEFKRQDNEQEKDPNEIADLLETLLDDNNIQRRRTSDNLSARWAQHRRNLRQQRQRRRGSLHQQRSPHGLSRRHRMRYRRAPSQLKKP